MRPTTESFDHQGGSSLRDELGVTRIGSDYPGTPEQM